MFSTFMLDLEDWLHDMSAKIKKNPLYLIPYIFLIGVILFVIVLAVAVSVLQNNGSP